jgi:hypothetical protein
MWLLPFRTAGRPAINLASRMIHLCRVNQAVGPKEDRAELWATCGYTAVVRACCLRVPCAAC